MQSYTLPMPKFLVYSGMGETKARQLINSKEIETAIIGGRRMVIVPSYHAYVERQRQAPQDARRNDTVPAFGTRRNKAGAIPEMETRRIAAQQPEPYPPSPPIGRGRRPKQSQSKPEQIVTPPN